MKCKPTKTAYGSRNKGKYKDLTGMIFGKLNVISLLEERDKTDRVYGDVNVNVEVLVMFLLGIYCADVLFLADVAFKNIMIHYR